MKKVLVSGAILILTMMILAYSASAADGGQIFFPKTRQNGNKLEEQAFPASNIDNIMFIENVQNDTKSGNATGNILADMPVIDLYIENDEEATLLDNESITVTADVYAIPVGKRYSLQWQNDRGGNYQDVPDATERSVTFRTDPANMESNWRVLLTVDDGTNRELFVSVSICPVDWVDMLENISLADPVYSREMVLVLASDETDDDINKTIKPVTMRTEIVSNTIGGIVLEDREENKKDFPAPAIELSMHSFGDTLTEGDEVTLVADVSGVPEGTPYRLQWQNNASGSFQDVPYARATRVTFYANVENVRCAWRVMLTLDTDSEPVAFASSPICPAERTPRPVDVLSLSPAGRLLTLDEAVYPPDIELQPEPDEEKTDALPDEAFDSVPDIDGTDADAASGAKPEVGLRVFIEDDVLRTGTKVTIIADVRGVPEGVDYTLQWQNNLSGEFRDVPGATDTSLAFPADENNVNCAWRVELIMVA